MSAPKFSLRTLLIVVTLAAAGLGWEASRVAERRRQDRMLEALRERLMSEGVYVQEWNTTRRGVIFRLRGAALGFETAEQLAAAQRVGAVIVELPTTPEIDGLLNQHFRETFVTNANTPTARQRWNR